jgi:hypothetical protein
VTVRPNIGEVIRFWYGCLIRCDAFENGTVVALRLNPHASEQGTHLDNWKRRKAGVKAVRKVLVANRRYRRTYHLGRTGRRSGRRAGLRRAMKMEHAVTAPTAGSISDLTSTPGDTVSGADVLCRVRP